MLQLAEEPCFRLGSFLLGILCGLPHQLAEHLIGRLFHARQLVVVNAHVASFRLWVTGAKIVQIERNTKRKLVFLCVFPLKKYPLWCVSKSKNDMVPFGYNPGFGNNDCNNPLCINTLTIFTTTNFTN